jgi:hypothetical protein
MSGDLQGTITSDASQALAALRKIRGELDGIAAATDKVNRKTADYQKQVKVGAKAGFKATGQGALGRDVFEGLGAGGWGGRLAVGIGVVGFAWTALSKVMEANVERTRQAITAERELQRARAEGVKTKEAQGRAGLAQGEGRRKAIALGGPDAQEAINTLVQSGDLSEGEAVKTVETVFGRLGPGRSGSGEKRDDPRNQARRDRIMAFASAFAQGGFSPTDFATEAMTRPQAFDSDDSALRFSRRYYAAQTGRRGDSVDQGLSAMIQMTEASRLLKESTKANQVDAQRQGIERTRAQEGWGVQAARGDLARANDPEGEARRAWWVGMQEQIDMLNRMSEAQGKFVEFLKNITDGQGGFGTQGMRLGNAAAGALIPSSTGN